MEKIAKEFVAKNVDEYLDAVPDAMRPVLEELRRVIRKAAPKAEELISYRIPTYKYKGSLVHFAAFTDHCSFIVINRSIIEKFKMELQGFKTSGTTIHFTPGKPVPDDLVQKIVKIRIRENERADSTSKKK